MVDPTSPTCGKNCGISEISIPNVGMRRGRGEANFKDRGISGCFQDIHYVKSRQNIQTNRMKGSSILSSVCMLKLNIQTERHIIDRKYLLEASRLRQFILSLIAVVWQLFFTQKKTPNAVLKMAKT